MALPTFERFRWVEDTLRRRWEQMLKDREAAEAAEAEQYLATIGAKKEEAKKEEEESSDEDHDPPEVVLPRLDLRPKTPPLALENEPPAPFTYMEGDRYMFLADGG